MSRIPPQEYLIGKVLKSQFLLTLITGLPLTSCMIINVIMVRFLMEADAMTVYSLGAPIMVITLTSAGILGVGGTFVLAEHRNRGDLDAMRNNFSVAMISAVVFGAIIACILELVTPILTSSLNHIADFEVEAEGYVSCLEISAAVGLVFQTLINYIKANGERKLVYTAFIASVATDVVLALYSTTCDLGVDGIGLSIGVGGLVGIGICMLYFIKKRRMIGFVVPRDFWNELKAMLLAGCPTAIIRGSITVKNLALGMFIITAMTASTVVSLSVQTVAYQFSLALGAAYGFMIAGLSGTYYYEKDRASLKAMLRATVHSGFIVSLALAIPGTAMADLFSDVSGDDMRGLFDVAEAMELFFFSLPSSTICIILIYQYQAIGFRFLSNIMALSKCLVFLLLFSVTLYNLIDVYGIWLSFVFSDLCTLLIAVLAVRIKTGRFPRRCEDFVLLSDRFDDVVDICAVSLRNDPSEVLELSNSVSESCRRLKIDDKRGNIAALCVREMTGNVVRHAYSDDAEHYIDVRIQLCGDDLIFRMRDDGEAFNPLECTETDHGIGWIKRSVSSMSYCRSAGMNSLTVVV